MAEPLDLLKAAERARARRKILGGVEGARRREALAASLDDTRSWVDPKGYQLSDRLWNARQADREAIDNLLRESLARGDDPIQTAKKLEAYLTPVGASQVTRTPRGGKGLYAARRLARTETTRAFGQATIEAAARARFPQLIRWRVSGRHDPTIDRGVCVDHQSNGPYEPRDVPRYPAHPNCRCCLLPYPKDDPLTIAQQLRRELQGEAS